MTHIKLEQVIFLVRKEQNEKQIYHSVCFNKMSHSSDNTQDILILFWVTTGSDLNKNNESSDLVAEELQEDDELIRSGKANGDHMCISRLDFT